MDPSTLEVGPEILADISAELNCSVCQGCLPTIASASGLWSVDCSIFVQHLSHKHGELHEVNALKHGHSLLYRAAALGYTHFARALVIGGAEINAKSKNGHTPLYISTVRGHEELALSLLGGDADPNCWTANGNSILHTACEHGRDLVVKYLLEVAGLEVNLEGPRGHTPLYLACQFGHQALAQRLIANKANTAALTLSGHSVLYAACKHGHESLVQWLMQDVGVCLNQTTRAGHSALHAACSNGFLGIAKLLITLGEDADQVDQEETPLYVACEKGQLEVARYLVETAGVAAQGFTPVGRFALYGAAKNGHLEVCRFLLLEATADVSQVTMHGHSALFSACEAGQLPVVQFIIAHAASQGVTSTLLEAEGGGHTPVYTAAEHGHSDVLRCLLAHKCSVNCRTKNGHSPLYIAVAKGKTECIKVLLDGQADVNLSTNNDTTPLHIAASLKDTEVIHLLLDANAMINAVTLRGHTPLYDVCMVGHHATARLLINRDADLDSLTKSRHSIWWAACESKQLMIFKTLKLFSCLRSTENLLVDSSKLLGFDPQRTEAAVQSWLSDSSGWGLLQLACDAREADLVLELLHTGGQNPHCSEPKGFTALRLASLGPEQSEWGTPPDKRIESMMSAATRRWTPQTSWAWPHHFHRGVYVLLLLQVKLANMSSLPVLSDSLWEEIIAFLPWEWKLEQDLGLDQLTLTDE